MINFRVFCLHCIYLLGDPPQQSTFIDLRCIWLYFSPSVCGCWSMFVHWSLKQSQELQSTCPLGLRCTYRPLHVERSQHVWFYLHAWMFMDPVQFVPRSMKKKSWWQWQRPPLGKPGEGKQFISFKIECLSWTHWGSGSFVTDSREYVYKQGQRKAGEMLFSLNFLLKMMTFTVKVFSFSGLGTTGSSSLPSHSFLHVITSYII